MAITKSDAKLNFCTLLSVTAVTCVATGLAKKISDGETSPKTEKYVRHKLFHIVLPRTEKRKIVLKCTIS